MSHLWTDNEDAFIPETGSLRVQPINTSQFSETLTAERTSIIELNSSYGPSALRDVQEVTGSAAIAGSATGEILINTGATASSVSTLYSGERVRYKPGHGAEMGIGVRIPTLPTGNKVAKWGLISPDGNEGAYWGIDATGMFTAIARDGTETKTYSQNWNVNKLDNTDTPNVDFDMTAGNIFQIDFTWYGYGQVLFQVVVVVNGLQQVVPVHWFKPSGATSLRTPNLPITAIVENGGDASDFEAYIGGRQACIVGKYNPKYRTIGQERIGVSTSTTSVPLVSFRNKVGFEDRSVLIDGGTANVETEDHIIEFYVNPTLTGASFGTPTNQDPAETALEVDTSATALSAGTLVFSFYANQGQSNKAEATDITAEFDIPENQIITMAARTVTGTGSADAFFRIREEWILVFALGADMIARAMSSLGGSLGGII